MTTPPWPPPWWSRCWPPSGTSCWARTSLREPRACQLLCESGGFTTSRLLTLEGRLRPLALPLPIAAAGGGGLAPCPSHCCWANSTRGCVGRHAPCIPSQRFFAALLLTRAAASLLPCPFAPLPHCSQHLPLSSFLCRIGKPTTLLCPQQPFTPCDLLHRCKERSVGAVRWVAER